MSHKLTLVQMTVRCCQVTSNYLNQCWRCFKMPCSVTSRQCEHSFRHLWRDKRFMLIVLSYLWLFYIAFFYGFPGCLGNVDRERRPGPGETWLEQHDSANTKWNILYLQHITSLSLHIRDQTNGHHCQGKQGYILYQFISPWVIWIRFYMINFQASFNDCGLRYLLWSCPEMNATGPYWE